MRKNDYAVNKKSGNLEESIQEYEKTAISDFKAG
jgi:hypothetical protein